jgi:hypothetical protein
MKTPWSGWDAGWGVMKVDSMALGRNGLPLGSTMENINFTRCCILLFKHYILLVGCSFWMPCNVGTSMLVTTTSGDRCFKF